MSGGDDLRYGWFVDRRNATDERVSEPWVDTTHLDCLPWGRSQIDAVIPFTEDKRNNGSDYEQESDANVRDLQFILRDKRSERRRHQSSEHRCNEIGTRLADALCQRLGERQLRKNRAPHERPGQKPGDDGQDQKHAGPTWHDRQLRFDQPACRLTRLGADGRELTRDLFDAAFGPADTYTTTEERASAIAGSEAAGFTTGLPAGWDPATGGVMQVHASCSDVFPGGIGSKSDPETSTQWLLANAHIDKGSKVCDLVMIELPPTEQEPDSEPPTTTTTTTPEPPPTTTTTVPTYDE